MVFDPDFTPTFVETVPANLLALVEAKQAEALAWANGGEALPPFVEFNAALPAEPSAPSITVERKRTGGMQGVADQRTFLISTSEFTVSIGLTGPKAGPLLKLLETYVKAVDAIIRSATREELLAGVEMAGMYDWDVAEHVYGRDIPEGTTHARAAALRLLVYPAKA